MNKTTLGLILGLLLFTLLGKTAVGAGSTESQIQRLSNTIGQQMGNFSQGMQQWGTGTMSDSAAVTLFKHRLIPFSKKLRVNYRNLGNLGKRLANKQDSKQLQHWAHRGMLIFSEWDQVLSKILYLNKQNNQVALQRFTTQRIPLISRRTAQFMQGLAQIINNTSQVNNNTSQMTNNQINRLQQQAQMKAQQKDIQMMSNMMNMQHETSMAIINNMAGSTVDHYENGVFVGNW